MIVNNFKSFPKNGKLLGIDWGCKRIGLAVSDERQLFVFARPILKHESKKKEQNFLKIISDEDIAGIVIGLPLRLDGTDSETTTQVRKFATELSSQTKIPIILFDESLTSFAAEDEGAKKDILDSESARILLENAISVINRSQGGCNS